MRFSSKNEDDSDTDSINAKAEVETYTTFLRDSEERLRGEIFDARKVVGQTYSQLVPELQNVLPTCSVQGPTDSIIPTLRSFDSLPRSSRVRPGSSSIAAKMSNLVGDSKGTHHQVLQHRMHSHRSVLAQPNRGGRENLGGASPKASAASTQLTMTVAPPPYPASSSSFRGVRRGAKETNTTSDTPPLQTYASQGERLITKEIASWRAQALEDRDKSFSSLYTWGRYCLANARQQTERNDEVVVQMTTELQKGGKKGASKEVAAQDPFRASERHKEVAAACLVLESLMNKHCQDRVLWSELRSILWRAIFVGWDEPKLDDEYKLDDKHQQQQFQETTVSSLDVSPGESPHTTNFSSYTPCVVTLADLEKRLQHLQELSLHKSRILEATANLGISKHRSEERWFISAAFRAWKMYVSNKKKHVDHIVSLTRSHARRRRLHTYFSQWRVSTHFLKRKRFGREREEAAAESKKTLAQLTTLVNSAKDEAARELTKTRKLLAEEKDLREIQTSGLSQELEIAQHRITRGEARFLRTKAEKEMWRQLWLDFRLCRTLPFSLSSHLLNQGRRVQSVLSSLFTHQFATPQDPLMNIPSATIRGVLEESSASGEQRQRLLGLLRERVEAFFVSWVNSVLSESSMSRWTTRQVINPVEDLCDGEIFLLLCGFLRRRRDDHLGQSRAPRVSYTTKEEAAALIVEFLWESIMRHEKEPIPRAKSLLLFCPYLNTKLSAANVLEFRSFGQAARTTITDDGKVSPPINNEPRRKQSSVGQEIFDQNWCMWVLAAIFQEYVELECLTPTSNIGLQCVCPKGEMDADDDKIFSTTSPSKSEDKQTPRENMANPTHVDELSSSVPFREKFGCLGDFISCTPTVQTFLARRNSFFPSDPSCHDDDGEEILLSRPTVEMKSTVPRPTEEPSTADGTVATNITSHHRRKRSSVSHSAPAKGGKQEIKQLNPVALHQRQRTSSIQGTAANTVVVVPTPTSVLVSEQKVPTQGPPTPSPVRDEQHNEQQLIIGMYESPLHSSSAVRRGDAPSNDEWSANLKEIQRILLRNVVLASAALRHNVNDEDDINDDNESDERSELSLVARLKNAAALLPTESHSNNNNTPSDTAETFFDLMKKHANGSATSVVPIDSDPIACYFLAHEEQKRKHQLLGLGSIIYTAVSQYKCLDAQTVVAAELALIAQLKSFTSSDARRESIS